MYLNVKRLRQEYCSFIKGVRLCHLNVCDYILLTKLSVLKIRLIY